MEDYFVDALQGCEEIIDRLESYSKGELEEVPQVVEVLELVKDASIKLELAGEILGLYFGE